MTIALPIVDFYALLFLCALGGWVVGTVVSKLIGNS